jgi:FMN reductase
MKLLETMESTSPKALIVGIGGSTRPGSSSERALCFALKAAESAGARTAMFGGAFLGRLPIYAPEIAERSCEQLEFVEAVRGADGIIVATPGYHGGVSGMVKNALDLLEDLRDDKRCYLEGRAVGCIITAFGWQTCGTTLSALRSIVHALRGWPTPMGAALNATSEIFDVSGNCTDQKSASQLSIVGWQVAEFARRFSEK